MENNLQANILNHLNHTDVEMTRRYMGHSMRKTFSTKTILSSSLDISQPLIKFCCNTCLRIEDAKKIKVRDIVDETGRIKKCFRVGKNEKMEVPISLKAKQAICEAFISKENWDANDLLFV